MYEQPFNPYADNLAIVKNYFKSKSVLTLGIINIISVVFAVAAVIFIGGAASNMMSGIGIRFYVNLNNYGPAASETAQQLGLISSILSAIPGVILGGLVAAAFFIIYSKSRNEAPDASPKAGVMILFVLSILQLVGVGIVVLMMAIFLIIMISLGSMVNLVASSGAFDTYSYDTYNYGNDYNQTAMVIVYVLLAVFAAVFIAYALLLSINKLRYYNSVRSSISSVELQNKGAKGYGVMCVISAVFIGISVLITVLSLIIMITGVTAFAGVSADSLIPFYILSLSALVISFVNMIIEAKVALGYKKYIDGIKYGYGQPVAPAAPYAPFPAAPAGYGPAEGNPYGAPQQSGPYYGTAEMTDRPAVDPNSVQPGAPAPEIPVIPDVDSSANPYADPYGEAAPKQPAAAPVCPACGAPVDPSGKFCGNCGFRLN